MLVSPDEVFSQTLDNAQEIAHKTGLVLGDWSESQYRTLSVSIPASHSVQHNGSLYAHIFLHQTAVKFPPPQHDQLSWAQVAYRKKLLTPYLVKRQQRIKKNLLSSKTENDVAIVPDEALAETIVSHWDRNLTLNFVSDTNPISLAEVQALPQMLKHIQFDIDRQPGLKTYLPTVFVNDFWTLSENLFSFPINETVQELPLHIEIGPMSTMKFKIMVQMHESFNMQKSMMGASDTEVDSLRRALFETNPWLLGVTMIVSLLHSLFDFLAFKNDIQFWKERKNFDGLSLRTILLNIGLQSVILLYLFDNDTSWLILLSSCVGLAIDIWKLRKVVVISIDTSRRSFYILPFTIVMKDLAPKTELRTKTDAYDAQAFKYLSWAAFPLVIGYSIYSLIYEEHKGVYSWVIGTAVGFVYTFGFITMTPQLFINYKLKSVAHMPWRTFMYKALNTFVDDLFAFVIKMPTLHRLACFRDDIIFFVYLYQKWKYPTDKTRPNEYGQVGEETAEDDKKIKSE